MSAGAVGGGTGTPADTRTDRPAPRALREARVDLDAIRENVRTLRAATAPATFMAVVKAGGYGHGALAVARAAVEGGADWLGVVDVNEALALRAGGITVPLLAWLHGIDTDFAPAIAANIDLGVSSLEQLDRIAATSTGAAATSPRPIYVHLKVDTGLGRNGIEESECPAVFDRAAEYERAGIIRVRGIFSHLANTSENENLEQVRRFEELVDGAEAAGMRIELRHLAATAAALRLPAARFDMVRCGIGIYGLSPFEGESSQSLGLRPAMQLSAGLISVKRVPADSGVSYGYTYRTAAESTLALVPLGYADGIPRQASSRGPVWINGRRYLISGRVAMDQFVVDLGNDTAVVGDRAVLFGDPSTGVPSADEWAEAADTINYEIVTRIGARVERTTTRSATAPGPTATTP